MSDSLIGRVIRKVVAQELGHILGIVLVYDVETSLYDVEFEDGTQDILSAADINPILDESCVANFADPDKWIQRKKIQYKSRRRAVEKQRHSIDERNIVKSKRRRQRRVSSLFSAYSDSRALYNLPAAIQESSMATEIFHLSEYEGDHRSATHRRGQSSKRAKRNKRLDQQPMMDIVYLPEVSICRTKVSPGNFVVIAPPSSALHAQQTEPLQPDMESVSQQSSALGAFEHHGPLAHSSTSSTPPHREGTDSHNSIGSRTASSAQYNPHTSMAANTQEATQAQTAIGGERNINGTIAELESRGHAHGMPQHTRPMSRHPHPIGAKPLSELDSTSEEAKTPKGSSSSQGKHVREGDAGLSDDSDVNDSSTLHTTAPSPQHIVAKKTAWEISPVVGELVGILAVDKTHTIFVIAPYLINPSLHKELVGNNGAGTGLQFVPVSEDTFAGKLNVIHYQSYCQHLATYRRTLHLVERKACLLRNLTQHEGPAHQIPGQRSIQRHSIDGCNTLPQHKNEGETQVQRPETATVISPIANTLASMEATLDSLFFVKREGMSIHTSKFFYMAPRDINRKCATAMGIIGAS